MPELIQGEPYDLFFRDPFNYYRQLNEAGESNVLWDQRTIFKRHIDPQKWMKTYFSALPWRIMVTGNWTTHEQDYLCDKDEVRAVYPSWTAHKNSLTELQDLIENPWGQREDIVTNKELKWFERPVWNQEHRIFIQGVKATGDQKMFNKIFQIQQAYPEVKFHLAGVVSFPALFGLGVKSADYNPSTEGPGRMKLPNGKKIKFEDRDEFFHSIKAMGFNSMTMDFRDTFAFNIASARYAAHHWSDETGPCAGKAGHKWLRDLASSLETSGKLSYSNHSGFPKHLIKESDKILCDSCALWRKCNSYRKGSVCNLSGTPSKKLSEMALSRDAGVITDMLASIVAKQADRAEKALQDETFRPESDGLDPAIDKMLNSVFKNGVQLAKLRDPTLGRPMVQINNVNSSGAIVASSDSRTMIAGIVQQLEAKGIAREDIDEDMVAKALQEAGQEDVQDAEVINEDDFPL